MLLILPPETDRKLRIINDEFFKTAERQFLFFSFYHFRLNPESSEEIKNIRLDFLPAGRQAAFAGMTTAIIIFNFLLTI